VAVAVDVAEVEAETEEEVEDGTMMTETTAVGNV
jgi:hypothetical protein